MAERLPLLLLISVEEPVVTCEIKSIELVLYRLRHE